MEDMRELLERIRKVAEGKREDTSSEGAATKTVRTRKNRVSSVPDGNLSSADYTDSSSHTTTGVEQPVRDGEANGSVATPTTFRGITPNVFCRLCTRPLGHYSPPVWYTIWCGDCNAYTSGVK